MLAIFPERNLRPSSNTTEEKDQRNCYTSKEDQKKSSGFTSQRLVSDFGDDVSNFSEDNIHLYWYKQARIPAYEMEAKWERLKCENNFATFTTLLKRLSDCSLGNFIAASDVVEVIQSVVDSEIICRLVFEEARDADADCEHRPLSIFNTIQGLARFSKLENQGASPNELLELAKALARQALLDEATLKMLSNRGTSAALSAVDEALEYQIALRRSLGKELRLPFSGTLDSAGYSSFRLSGGDIQFVISYVSQNMRNVDCLVEVLVNLPIWKQHMERVCQAEKTKITFPLGKRMQELENERQMSNSLNYDTSMRQLALEREEQIERMLKVETKKLLIQTESGRNLKNCTEEPFTFCKIF